MHDEKPSEPSSSTLPTRDVGDGAHATESGPLSGDSSDAGDADDIRVIHLRLNGPGGRVDEVVAGLDELPGVESVVQLIMDAPVQRDDSSTAESIDDNPSSFQEIELEIVDPQAWDDARHLIEGRAARANVVLEWLDRF